MATTDKLIVFCLPDIYWACIRAILEFEGKTTEIKLDEELENGENKGRFRCIYTYPKKLNAILEIISGFNNKATDAWTKVLTFYFEGKTYKLIELSRQIEKEISCTVKDSL